MTPSLALAPEDETAPINGVDIYYTVQGEGPPLILIHGGLGNSDYWENQTPVLAEEYTLIAMDSRAHGRSTFDDTPVGYDLMMTDVIGLMDYLEIEIAFVLGVIAPSICSTSMPKVSGSTSTRMGMAPCDSAALIVATKVYGVVITSSPGPTPTVAKATSSAAVPLTTQMPFRLSAC